MEEDKLKNLDKNKLNPDIINKSIISKMSFIKTIKGDITQFYEVLKKIGEGSYGKIYRVKNKVSGDIRAMKQIVKAKIPDIDGFKNEIHILSLMDHPNIVRLFEVFEDDKYYYLLIELCSGGELLKRIKNYRKHHTNFPEREAAIIFKQLISAVTYMHSKGICHRDLKPENILFSTEEPDSPIKVIDFGFSILLREKNYNNENSDGIEKEKLFEKMSAKVGTLYYISPEIIKGNYDEKCDVWACGVILYVILCGYPPFNGKTDKEIYKNIASEKFDFPQKDWKIISKQAKDLISNMLCSADKRLSAKKVLESKWIEKKGKSKTEIDPNDFDGIKLIEFKFYNKLKQAALTFIASRLGENECKKAKELFFIMDRNKNGSITIEDFSYNLLSNEQTKDVDEEDIKEMFSSIDVDHSGKIDYTEFLAANMDKEIFLKEEKLREVFRAFSQKDGNVINKEDIQEILNLAKSPENETVINQIIEENDYDKDNKINFDDFIRMMKQEIVFDEEDEEYNEENENK